MRALWAAVLLAGCLAPLPAPPVAPEPCRDPWPCLDGSEWPAELAGPFDLARIERIRVPMDDGVELSGAVFFPDVPEGTRLPIVLHAMPYGGQCYETPLVCAPAADDPAWLTTHFDPMGPIVEAGYALANVNVRGTGDSGGCFDFNGPRERRDLALLVEALAALPWSNGRVGMFGMSYMGTTPWLAAAQAPPALKTIVPMGIVLHEYTYDYTPQGAATLTNGPPGVLITGSVGLYPALGAGPQGAAASLRHTPGRVCPEVARTMANFATDAYADRRDAEWYAERDHASRLSGMRASVFVLHGLRDLVGHTYQEDLAWDWIPDHLPRRMAVGPWSHVYAPAEAVAGHPDAPGDWSGLVLPWLDYWLKGLGEAPHLGRVEYGDSAGRWRTTSAWPPPEGEATALRLAPGTLGSAAGEWSQPLLASTVPTAPLAGSARSRQATPFCEAERGGAGALAFSTAPVPSPVVIAGNPFALLRIESSAPRGLVAADLYDVGPDARCGPSGPEGVAWISAGAADLRFHQGNLAARDFPVGAVTDLRIDLFNLAHRLEAGHRLVLVVSGYGEQAKTGTAGPFRLTLAGTEGAPSELVLPVVEGALDGAAPAATYPPRPFAPP